MFEIARNQRHTLIVNVIQKRLSTGLFCSFERFLNAQLGQKNPIILFDFSNAKSINFSATAELLEIYRAYNAIIDIAFCALPELPAFSESSYSLAQLLPLYSSTDAALKSDEFSIAQMRSLHGIVLAGDSPQNILPSFPPTLLPIMGHSLLQHNLQHLEKSGIRDVTVETGQFGTAIRRHLQLEIDSSGSHIGFYNSPTSLSASIWGKPMHRLSELQNTLSVFRRDTIVMLGHALPNTEILSTYHAHQSSDADITLVVPPPKEMNNQRGFLQQDCVTCLLIKGGALDGPPLPDIGFSYRELSHFFSRRGQKVHTVYATSETGIVSSLKAYIGVLSAALAGRYPLLRLKEFEPQGFQWRHPEAEVSPDLMVEGACYIGPGVKIASGVKIIGPASIESGCQIGRGARVEHSVLSEAHHTPAHALRRDVFASMDKIIPLHRSKVPTSAADILNQQARNPLSKHMRAS